MAITDTNAIIYTYLMTQTALTAVATGGIFCPRLPENTTLPAISFFTRGGTSTPYIPGIINPSVQFDCWATDTALVRGSIKAREVYRALYDALQGIQNIYVGNLVIGTDSKTYRCIQAHTSAAANKPITGANYATYWAATDGVVTGSIWVTGTAYTLTYQIMSAIEEVQGQDLVDEKIPNYFRVLTFFTVMIRAE